MKNYIITTESGAIICSEHATELDAAAYYLHVWSRCFGAIVSIKS